MEEQQFHTKSIAAMTGRGSPSYHAYGNKPHLARGDLAFNTAKVTAS